MPSKAQHTLQRSRSNLTLEKTVLFVAIVEPLMTTPQILQIYGEDNTGVSILTWALYLGASLVWLIYGIKIRNIPIIVTDVLWIIVEVAVIVGVITH